MQNTCQWLLCGELWSLLGGPEALFPFPQAQDLGKDSPAVQLLHLCRGCWEAQRECAAGRLGAASLGYFQTHTHLGPNPDPPSLFCDFGCICRPHPRPQFPPLGNGTDIILTSPDQWAEKAGLAQNPVMEGRLPNLKI